MSAALLGRGQVGEPGVGIAIRAGPAVGLAGAPGGGQQRQLRATTGIAGFENRYPGWGLKRLRMGGSREAQCPRLVFTEHRRSYRAWRCGSWRRCQQGFRHRARRSIARRLHCRRLIRRRGCRGMCSNGGGTRCCQSRVGGPSGHSCWLRVQAWQQWEVSGDINIERSR